MSEQLKSTAPPQVRSTVRREVALALYSKRLSALHSAEAWEAYDKLVLNWLLGTLPDVKNVRLLEALVLNQPSIVESVKKLKGLIRARRKTSKGATNDFRKLLSRSANRCILYWVKIFPIESHRPPDRENLERAARAARMRTEGIPWPRIIRELFPSTGEGSISAIKKGVQRFRAERESFLKQFPTK